MTLQTAKVFELVQEAFKERFSICSAQGSSRSGKTYNIIIWLVYYALTHNVTISICRKTLPSLKRSVLRDFQKIVQQCRIPVKANKTDLTFVLQNGKNQSLVEFFSVNDEERLRGSKRDILFVNEANEITEQEWVQLNMRTTLFSILDYNPSFSDDFWICGVNKRKDCKHFITTYKDNPFLEKKVIQEIENLKYTNKSLWEIYGLGLQAQAEGLVFPKITLVDTFPDYAKKVCLSADYGFTNDPTAIVKCGVYENKLFIDQIEYSTYLLTSDIIKILRPYKQYTLISEIDNRLIAELKQAGYNVEKVKKNDVMTGISKMQQMEICITKQSVDVIKEFKNYTFINKDGRYINQPIDAFNHSIDAIRYYCLMRLFDGGRGMFYFKPIMDSGR